MKILVEFFKKESCNALEFLLNRIHEHKLEYDENKAKLNEDRPRKIETISNMKNSILLNLETVPFKPFLILDLIYHHSKTDLKSSNKIEPEISHSQTSEPSKKRKEEKHILQLVENIDEKEKRSSLLKHPPPLRSYFTINGF